MDRTGLAHIDALIERFADLEIDSGLGEHIPVRSLVHGETAAGRCGEANSAFARFLRENGARAFWSGDTAPPNGRLHHTPEDFGYYDRPREGISRHSVTLLKAANERYMIDWTASQYGYDQFPMVQRWRRGHWERTWTLVDPALALPASVG